MHLSSEASWLPWSSNTSKSIQFINNPTTHTHARTHTRAHTPTNTHTHDCAKLLGTLEWHWKYRSEILKIVSKNTGSPRTFIKDLRILPLLPTPMSQQVDYRHRHENHEADTTYIFKKKKTQFTLLLIFVLEATVIFHKMCVIQVNI